MEYIYQWLRKKVTSEPIVKDEEIKEKDNLILTNLDEEKMKMAISKYYSFSKSISQITQNSIWGLLSDFTMISETFISIKSEGYCLSDNEDNYERSLSPFHNLLCYQKEVHSLYIHHTHLEADILNLLSLDLNKSSSKKINSILIAFDTFFNKINDTVKFFDIIINDINNLYDHISTSKGNATKTQNLSIKLPVIELLIGVPLPYFQTENISLSILSCNTSSIMNRNLLEVITVSKDFMSKLIVITIEKRETFEKIIEYFKELKDNLNILKDTYKKEIRDKIKMMVPLKTLNLLL